MSQFQIVCTERLGAHRHITHVGTGSGGRAANRWTVQQVRTALEGGDTFYTVSPSTGRIAYVEAYDAYSNGQVIQTLRSSPDAVSDNNLDNLRVCEFQS